MDSDEFRFNNPPSALIRRCRFSKRKRLCHIFGRRPATTEQPMNPLLELLNHKQSVWLDYIRRDLIVSGGLRGLVDRDGLRGVTSNPTIFEKAIDGSTDYDEGIAEALARNPKATAKELYDVLVVEDVRHATDILRPSYDESGG